MEKLSAAFASRKLDGVIVGFGIRGIPENTYLFEKVVAAVRQGAPQAKLMFNTSPDTTVDAAKRWITVSA